jgi:hypothetical protein
MDDHWNLRSIKQLLNPSLEQIDQLMLCRLHAARTRALNAHEAYETFSSLDWAGRDVIRHVSAHCRKVYNWIGIFLLVACFSNGIAYYWQETIESKASETDVEILTGDQPIEYFIE